MVDPASVKMALKKLGATVQPDNIGEDTNHDGMYGGKSLALGGGGRTLLLAHKIAKQLVMQGVPLDDALKIGKQKAVQHGMKKYGAKKMLSWAHNSNNSNNGSMK